MSTQTALRRWIVDSERVPDRDVCPDCGEDLVDELVWNEWDEVCCQTCGALYDPNEYPED